MKGSFNDIIQGDKPVLVDFFATWCGPCNYQGPILEELATAVGDEARIIKIDIDRNQAVAAKYNVRSVPTLMIFKNGEVKWKEAGVKEKEQLIQLLRSV
ncbi:MAG: thioredoxin [Flavobacteriales bacterium]|jgi:thioredoxin 1|nr:thioredoxin [Flavobacteriales bacterium]MDP4717084.1 thioredoxin [Flavobacteriales bacterium]MDP4731714.1 thioredoxin [Flavobacteriales bacterium]MDP4819086.1 thioredoxin [Flavobacteriales bacterium]MDP4951591.1 thioredoxin [Flavobacteriales bacterium]